MGAFFLRETKTKSHPRLFSSAKPVLLASIRRRNFAATLGFN